MIAFVALAVLGTASARADATVSVTPSQVVDYEAVAGLENRPNFQCQFHYDGTEDQCVVQDFEGVTAGSGCVQDSSTQVTCVGHFFGPYPVVANLGDFDDVAIVRFTNSVNGIQIDAGSGHDYVESGDGTGGDDVRLGSGDDWLEAGYGSDSVFAGGGQDTVIGGASYNIIHGGAGSDNLLSGAWIGTGSRLHGDNGNDHLQGGWAADLLYGGRGDDYLDGGRANDGLDGGADFDTVDFDSRTEPVSVTFNGQPDDGGATYDDSPFGDDRDNVATNVEKVIGGQNTDTLTAGASPVTLLGGPEADLLIGSDAADTLRGEGGADAMRGKLGPDTLDGGVGTDEILYDERAARLAIRLDGLRNDGADPNGDFTSGPGEEGDLDLSVERARGGSAGDYLRGNALVNRLMGNDGNDDMQASDGTTGVDIVLCGIGTDRFDVDATDSTTGCETPAILP